MRVLLDTHAFIWWIGDDAKLSPDARQLVSDGSNEVFFSAVSAWEILLKKGLERVEIPEPLEPFITSQVLANAFQVLPINLRHVFALSALPDVHQDPFDRMLVSQAVADDLTILSADRHFQAYPVDVVW
ncbi:MAG: type II toxin-antitoxin system VapC family toxin [Actinomycetota bacterium]